MKLSIIIPQFAETEDVIKPLLSSIENQVGFNLNDDLEVVIVNDGSEVKLSEAFLKSFKKLNIAYIVNETNGGPSVARNIGLKQVSGDYVMFCDADDRFLDMAALMQIMSAICKDIENNQPIDMYNWDFIEEAVVNNSFRYIKHAEDFVFLHGNIYRKAFLGEQNITFCDELRKEEDVYFNAICRSMAQHVRIMPGPLYVWCYNPYSISREPESRYTKYPLLVKTAHKIVESLLARDNERAALYVMQFHYHTYFQMQTPRWLDRKRKDYKKTAEQAFYEFHTVYEKYLDQVPPQIAADLYAQERRNIFEKTGSFETETYPQFLGRLAEQSASAEHA